MTTIAPGSKPGNRSRKQIASNTPPEIDGVEGYKSLDVILTAMEAGKEGRTHKIG